MITYIYRRGKRHQTAARLSQIFDLKRLVAVVPCFAILSTEVFRLSGIVHFGRLSKLPASSKLRRNHAQQTESQTLRHCERHGAYTLRDKKKRPTKWRHRIETATGQHETQKTISRCILKGPKKPRGLSALGDQQFGFIFGTFTVYFVLKNVRNICCNCFLIRNDLIKALISTYDI